MLETKVKRVRKSKKVATVKARKPRQRKSKKQRMGDIMPTSLSKSPRAIRLSDVHYDPSIFVTMPTNTIVDKFFSNKGGIPKATNFIIIGDPGCGKCVVAETSVTLYNKKTGERFVTTIGEFHKSLKK